MKRRVSGMEFALVWGKVSRWGQQDRDDLVELLQEGGVRGAEPKKREPRKPKQAMPGEDAR